MPNVLNSQNPSLRKEACITLTNIFHHNFDDYDYIIDNQIIPILIDIISKDEDEVRLIEKSLNLMDSRLKHKERYVYISF